MYDIHSHKTTQYLNQHLQIMEIRFPNLYKTTK